MPQLRPATHQPFVLRHSSQHAPMVAMPVNWQVPPCSGHPVRSAPLKNVLGMVAPQ